MGKIPETVKRNASQVRRFLTLLLPRLERSTAISDEPFDRKARGSSRAPLPDSALWLIESNRDAIRILNPIVAEVRASGVSYRGARFDWMLSALSEDPGVVRRWEARRTAFEERRADALEEMCLLVAYAVRDRYGPEREIRVVTNPRDEELPSGTTPRQARDRERKLDARDSWRKMAASVERVEREQGASREAAKEMVAREYDCCVSTVEKALTFVKRERQDARAVNAEWERRARDRREWAS